jgi:uncharacterized membrane protein YfcA
LTETAVIASGIALLIGLSLGLLGGGGSILMVPALVYALGFDVKPAVAMSLFVVGLTSLVGAAAHWRLGNVRLPSAALFSGFAMAGAFAGARLSTFLSGTAQLALLALVMLAASVSMFRRPSPRTEQDGPRVAPRPTLLVPVAIGVGVLTGLLGVGGGFLVVPALAVLARVPMRQAVGTSLVVIALNSASGFVGYLGIVPVDWTFLAGFTAVAAAGALGGAAMMRLVSISALRRSFAVLLLAVGTFLLSRNLLALGGTDQGSAPPRLPATITTR